MDQRAAEKAGQQTRQKGQAGRLHIKLGCRKRADRQSAN